ncbi:MAG: hypothetical protein JWO93_1198 [Micrococcaceae bacterium]|nr:hypothetical protein [Micrococcaceae bacterium]
MIATITLISGLFTLVMVLALVLPSINSPTVPFGVRVPAGHADDPTVVRQTRLYRRRVLLSGIVVAVAGAIVYEVTGETLLLPLPLLVLVGIWYGCFFLANHGIRAAKAAGNWFEGLRQGIAVDTALRTDPQPFPLLWLAPALIITTATVVIGVITYPSMPEMLTMHYGANGVSDRLAAKSVGTAFSLVFLQVGLTALLVGIAVAIYRSHPDIDPAHPLGSSRWYRRYMSLGIKALLGLVAMIDLGMLGLSLLMWTGTVTPWAPLIVALPILAAVVVAVVVLARNNRERDAGEQDTGLTHRDDDKNWHGGLFYINPDDPALMVPRRFGLGWALNFGNPRAAMLLAGVLALISVVITLRLNS